MRVKPEDLIGKRVELGDGRGRVVSIKRRDGNGGVSEPMAVVSYDGYNSITLVRLSEISRLNDYTFEAL